ncbi:30S ribosomal protein S2 [bacterium]|nr:30S ribosomal protein S2 [bacterium]
MALISLRQLLECGVHFGHPTRKWNPKMAPFIYTKRNGIHIIDLQQTTALIDEVHAYVQRLVNSGKKILFVGTKKQAQTAVREEATKCGMPYVNKRWLGGLLTNTATISKRTERLRELRKLKEEGNFETLTKKDQKFLEDELARLEKFLGGVADLDGMPDALFIVDVNRESNAVKEAQKLGIPIIGILDTNCDPNEVDYKLPGNDDAIRSIRLFCQIIADSVMEAKYGYLPPDSVFIQPADEEKEEAGKETAAVSKVASGEEDSSAPAAQPEADAAGFVAVSASAEPPASALPEGGPVVIEAPAAEGDSSSAVEASSEPEPAPMDEKPAPAASDAPAEEKPSDKPALATAEASAQTEPTEKPAAAITEPDGAEK